MFDTVAAQPGGGMRLRCRDLSVEVIDCQADVQDRAHLARPRADLDFAGDFAALLVPAFLFAARVLFVLPTESSPLSRAHESAALTARCHPCTRPAAADYSIAGVNRVNCLVPMHSATSRPIPPPIPGRPAAPSAVVSIMSGRSTGMPSTSAWHCSNQPLAAAPPSTRSD